MTFFDKKQSQYLYGDCEHYHLHSLLFIHIDKYGSHVLIWNKEMDQHTCICLLTTVLGGCSVIQSR